ncbi:MAG: hypothetical protein KDK12_12785 [Rhodobacteraceae bacterium]|nr:hypothetical protein [Paracoccaceae bacterium]
MKKLLLATSALIASATIANAQAVTISGEGRMGIMVWDNGVATAWTQENRLTLNFNVAIEADHGLSFGAWTSARTQSSWWGSYTGTFSGSRVWVEASGVRLTFGNVDGAMATAGVSHGYLGGCGVGYEGGPICGDSVGLLTIAHQEVNPGAGSPSMALVTYTSGDTVVAVSHQRGVSTEIGARTSFGAFTVAAGYTTLFDVWTISGHYDGGAWGAGAIVAANSVATNWALSGNVQVLGGNLYGYVGRVFTANAYGLSFGYDLGGGATLTAGAERVGNLTMGSLGVAFTF